MSGMTLAMGGEILAKAGKAAAKVAGPTLCGGSKGSCMPIDRWGQIVGPINFRGGSMDDGNIGGKLISPIYDFFNRIPAMISGAITTWSNSLYMSANDMIKSVTNWTWEGAASSRGGKGSLVNTFGASVNDIAAGIWRAISANYGLLGAIACIALIALLVRQIRLTNGGASTFKRAIAMVTGIGLFCVMGAQAAASTAAVPAVMSPAWIAKTAGTVVNTVGGGMANSIAKGLADVPNDVSKPKGSHTGVAAGPGWKVMPLSCQAYINALDKQANLDNSITPDRRAINSLWEQTSYQNWASEYYGGVDEGDYVACRVAEANAGIPAAEQVALTAKAAGSAFQPTSRTVNAAMFNRDALAPSADQANGRGQDVQNDELSTMWETVGLRDAKGGADNHNIYTRAGWGFVNLIPGTNRGLGKADFHIGVHAFGVNWGKNLSGYNANAFHDQLAAALYGQTPDHPWTYGAAGDEPADKTTAYNPDGSIAGDTSSGDNTGEANFFKLVHKFDLPLSSGWRGYATSKNNNGTEQQKLQAVSTVAAQQGSSSLSQLGPSILALNAAFVNFLLFGVCTSIIRVLALFAAFMMTLGIWVCLLLWAVSPDKFGQRIKDYNIRMLNMCGVNVLIEIFFTLDVLVSMLLMDVVCAMTAKNAMMVSVCAFFFPPLVALMFIDFLKKLGFDNLTPRSILHASLGGGLLASGAVLGMHALGHAARHAASHGFSRRSGDGKKDSKEDLGTGEGGKAPNKPVRGSSAAEQAAEAVHGGKKGLHIASKDDQKKAGDLHKDAGKWAKTAAEKAAAHADTLKGKTEAARKAGQAAGMMHAVGSGWGKAGASIGATVGGLRAIHHVRGQWAKDTVGKGFKNLARSKSAHYVKLHPAHPLLAHIHGAASAAATMAGAHLMNGAHRLGHNIWQHKGRILAGAALATAAAMATPAVSGGLVGTLGMAAAGAGMGTVAAMKPSHGLAKAADTPLTSANPEPLADSDGPMMEGVPDGDSLAEAAAQAASNPAPTVNAETTPLSDQVFPLDNMQGAPAAAKAAAAGFAPAATVGQAAAAQGAPVMADAASVPNSAAATPVAVTGSGLLLPQNTTAGYTNAKDYKGVNAFQAKTVSQNVPATKPVTLAQTSPQVIAAGMPAAPQTAGGLPQKADQPAMQMPNMRQQQAAAVAAVKAVQQQNTATPANQTEIGRVMSQQAAAHSPVPQMDTQAPAMRQQAGQQAQGTGIAHRDESKVTRPTWSTPRIPAQAAAAAASRQAARAPMIGHATAQVQHTAPAQVGAPQARQLPNAAAAKPMQVPQQRKPQAVPVQQQVQNLVNQAHLQSQAKPMPTQRKPLTSQQVQHRIEQAELKKEGLAGMSTKQANAIAARNRDAYYDAKSAKLFGMTPQEYQMWKHVGNSNA